VRKLEEAKLLRVHKEFVDRKPRTTFECTALGRRELRDYLSRLEAMLSAARADSGGQ
jgi:DNA-binding PadR family transcriptional regulator